MLSGHSITPVIMSGPMEPGDIIKEAREKRRLSQKELGDLVGISQPAIKKIEAGETAHSKFLPRIAQILSLDLSSLDASLVGSENPVSRLPPVASLYGPRDFPIYAAAEGGPEGEIIRSAEPVDWSPRPIEVQSVRDAYGMMVVGTSMIPEFEPGHVAVVNPHLPPVTGRSCIFYTEDKAGQARATIKRFRRQTMDQWFVTQHNPPEGQKQDFTLSRNLWRIAHRIVGRQDN